MNYQVLVVADAEEDVFGMAEQLLLCRSSKPQAAGKNASKVSNKK